MILFLLGTGSIFWSANVGFFIGKWLLWLIIFYTFFVAYCIKQTHINLLKLAFGLTIAGRFIAIIGIFQYLSPDTEFLLQSAPPSSTFGNKNMAAHSLVLIFPVILFIIFSNKINTMQTFLAGFLIAVIVIYIFYTATKSAWLAISIELLFVALFLRLKRKKINNYIYWNRTKTISLSLSVLLIFIKINLSADSFTPVWQAATNEISSMVQSTSNKNDIRYEIYQISINMIKNMPLFGTGLGS